MVLLFNIYSDVFFLPLVSHKPSWLHARRHTKSNRTITDRWRQMDCGTAQTEKSFGQTFSPGLYSRDEDEDEEEEEAEEEEGEE